MSVEKAAGAGAWSAIDIVLRQGVSFFVSIILARLLSPEDFGLIALLTFFSSLSVVFVQGGLTVALIQRQRSSHEEESAVFWVNLLAAGVFAALLILIAPLVASFYGYPVLRPLMFVAAAQIVLSALGAVQAAILTRDLRFIDLTKTGIVSSLISAVAGIAAAAAGWGVWALAVQLLASAGVATVALWAVSDWRPSTRFDLTPIGNLYRFGLGISLSSMLEVIYAQGFALLLGKLHGVRDLGLFNRATNTQALPGSILSAIISRVALPLFAARAADPQALRRGLRMALSAAMLISLPTVAGLALLSDLIMLCLFGAQWTAAAKILTILALAGSLLPFHVLNLQLLLALGKSKEYLKIEVKKKLVGIVAVIIGSYFGIEGLAYALVGGSVASLLFNSAPTRRLIDYSVAQQIWDVKDVIFATFVMSLVVLLLRMYVALDPWASLSVLSAAGASTYMICGFLLRLPSFKHGLEMANLAWRKKQSEASPAPD